MIDSRYIVTLQGKDYPTYPGVLQEAHERGLSAITVALIQVPDEGNGHTAICSATVVMKDGSTFSDIGDASPRNVNSKIATALMRMASTRAKGRALRDAVNIGQTLLEELPDLGSSDHASSAPPAKHDPFADEKPIRSNVPPSQPDGSPCAACGLPVPKGRAAYCAHNNLPLTHPQCEA